MIDKIRSIKDEMLMQAEQDMHEQGRVDPMVIDNIKDLAEAEKYCMESEKLGAETDYFQSIVDSMQEGQMGYDDGMWDDGMGYARGSGYARHGGSGYDGVYERGGRRGYNRGRGYEQGGRRGYRRGYRGQPRDSQGQYTSRRGYRRESYGHQDMMQDIKQMAQQMMESADPQEKEQLKMQLRQMTEQM